MSLINSITNQPRYDLNTWFIRSINVAGAFVNPNA